MEPWPDVYTQSRVEESTDLTELVPEEQLEEGTSVHLTFLSHCKVHFTPCITTPLWSQAGGCDVALAPSLARAGVCLAPRPRPRQDMDTFPSLHKPHGGYLP